MTVTEYEERFWTTRMTEPEKRMAVVERERQNVKMMHPFLWGQIIEIGCNRGDLLKELRRQGYNAVGADVMKPLHPKAIKASATKIPCSDRKFNTVILSHTFAHIQPGDMSKADKEISRILSDDGTLIIIGSDIACAQAWICPHCGKKFSYTHRSYRRPDVEKALPSFEIEEVKKFIPALFWAGFPMLRYFEFLLNYVVKTRNSMYILKKRR